MSDWENELLGALARGYCHKENEHKVLDATLIKAMAEEVEAVIRTLLEEERSTISATMDLQRTVIKSQCADELEEINEWNNVKKLDNLIKKWRGK